MDELLRSILEILAGEEKAITIRHLFYRLVGLRVIEKTEGAYKALCGHLAKWRRSGEVPWDAFVDSTRWKIQDNTFDSVKDALRNTVENYRRNLWDSQSAYVEVWVEKDAIAGLVADTANSFGVPVFVARGFASLSSLHSAAQTFRHALRSGKRVTVYHLGDFDPSGVAARESIENSLRDDFKVDVDVVRAAVTAEQITNLKLPTRPVKLTDGRSKKWTGGECVELDSMPPQNIRDIVTTSITQHIDPRQWQLMQTTEAEERKALEKIWRKAA